MARYNYLCEDCERIAEEKFGNDMTQEQFEEHVLFETSHAMNPTEEELEEAKKCPRCGGINCRICLYGTEIHSYIRGYGWLDKAGATRDRNVYTLTHNDPYSQYRESGEVEDIKQKLQRAGTRGGTSTPKHFVQNDKSMTETVRQVTKPKTDS